jgi:putative membrane protein
VHWWGWLLGVLSMVAFWGLLVWSVWHFVIAVTRRETDPRVDDPKRILDERLARGEIDAEEYRRLRGLMSGEPDQARHGQEPVGTGNRR